MPKISINLLGWNHKEELAPTIEAVLRQTFLDFELIFTDNASSDGSADFVAEHYPQVKVVGNQKNLGYAGGHNKFFASAVSEFVMVLNPDVRLEPNFLEEALKPFADPRVAAVTGKLLRPPLRFPLLDKEGIKGEVLDTTGLIVNRARRGRDRGQWEEDRGQYDGQNEVFGSNGAAPIFRLAALEKVKIPFSAFSSPRAGDDARRAGEGEYYDEDFFAYWEDLDLSWRLKLAGFNCGFAPRAVAYHGRAAGQSRGGYLKIMDFIKHHRKLPPNIKKWNWRNHLFCVIKNDFGWPFWRDLPFILARELAMFMFILIFETRTLSVIPEFLRLLPKMLIKRRYIQKYKQVSSKEVLSWF
ncbi:MAG: glycosyltransferase family 2 protein [Patescibacteria group bacterium]|mgnify:CR=1 FL=1